MEKTQAEENIKLIRDIMERSTRYTHFSGLSGIIGGILALIGCYLTVVVFVTIPVAQQNAYYLLVWISVLVLAIAQDLALAQRKAKSMGQTIWVPATYQAIKALLPGVFIAFILSLNALVHGAYDVIPAYWALGYGAALVSAGMFSIKELRMFGCIQLATGAFGLFFMSYPAHSLILTALSFGVYHILYAIWMSRKYGW